MASPSSASRLPLPITSHIVGGHAWTARHIHNQSLRYHCRQLGRTFQKPESTQADRLRGLCLPLVERLECASDVLTEALPERRQIIPAVLRIAAYSCRWVRGPDTWQADRGASPSAQFRSLVRHLFARYELPPFYQNAWFERGDLEWPDRDWYCHVAQGGNIRRAPGIPPSLTRRAAHLMTAAPTSFSLRRAIRFGQLRALGLPLSLMDEVLASPAATDFSNDPLWIPLFMMLARERSPEIADLREVLEFLHGRAHEHYPRRLTLKARSFADLVRSARRSLRDHLALARRFGIDYTVGDLDRVEVRRHLRSLAHQTWDPMPGVGPFEVSHRKRWQVVEICSQSELTIEGRDLHHCVAGYGSKCRAGRAAIFSLRLWLEGEERWDPWATIEVDLEERRVTQAKSVWNQAPGNPEVEVIGRWAEANKMKFSG